MCLAGIFPASTFASKTVAIRDVEYTIDTLRHVKTGPGTTYTALLYTGTTGKTMRGFFLTMDLKNNPNVEYRVELGQDTVLNTEQPSAIAKRKSAPGNYYFAGINAGFYIVSSNVPSCAGTPNEMCIVNGVIGTNGWDDVDRRGQFFMDHVGGVWCDIPTHSFGCTLETGARLVFDDVNIVRPSTHTGPNKLLLLNEKFGNYTKTSGRTEVLVELAPEMEWGMNRDIEATVIAAPTVGGVKIGHNQAVLSADGTRVDEISSLKPGDKVVFRFDLSLKNHGVAPDIKECAGGDVVILDKGEVVMEADRWINPRDSDNPRTMAGYDKDRNIMVWGLIDGRSSISSGCTYPEGAEIMRLAGCYDAVNFDGGGSSAMYLQNLGIMNKPSDGNERAVANGLFAVLKAPEDNTIAEIQFAEYKFSFPFHGIYTPKFYGYNKYGMLIDTDVQGVTLECEPELGEIINGGTTFYGNGSGCHRLTARLGDITTHIPVTIFENDNVHARLANVVNDGYKDYTVEVIVNQNDDEMPINPAALSWSSDNESVASVDAATGVVKGLSDGTAVITGRIGDVVTSVNVLVQKPVAHTAAIDAFDVSTWSVRQTGGTNTTLSPLATGFSLEYDGASGRNPSIRLEKNIDLWSLPDSIIFDINPGEAPVKLARVYLRDAIGEQYTIVAENLVANTVNKFKVPVSDLFDAGDLVHFPLSFTAINMLMNASTAGVHYTITVPRFETVYDAIPAGVEDIIADSKRIVAYPNPVAAGETIILMLPGDGETKVEFYNLSGALVASTIATGSDVVTVPTTGLAPGEYLLRAVRNNETHTTIIIIN